ncbi:hypothetical protein AKJ16_DCAP04657 [Drosera capensis]
MILVLIQHHLSKSKVLIDYVATCKWCCGGNFAVGEREIEVKSVVASKGDALGLYEGAAVICTLMIILFH